MNYSRIAIGCGVLLVATSWAAEPATPTLGQTSGSPVEEIYVAHSLRESRAAITEFCAKSRIGFDSATSEDHYTFRSTTVRASDGRIVDNNVHAIGRLRACFGSTDDPKLLNFYAEGALGSATFTGRGECLAGKADYPEIGITTSRCFLHLGDLPKEYVGGELTTNSIRSRNVIGDVSDPPGYTQPSIATIRLWRRRS